MLSMKRLRFAIAYMCLLAFLGAGAQAVAQDPVRDADLRLLGISERIQNANVGMCDRQAPALGVALQSRDQFLPEDDPGFQAPVAFAVILPESPLARAGVALGDGLVAINGTGVEKRPGLETMPLRDSAYAMLADRTNELLTLTVVHGGQEKLVNLKPATQCRALVEVLVGSARAARSDGRVIQIGLGLMTQATDDEVAAVFAHELAHSVLHHRDRLANAGVSKGLAGEFGRHRQLSAAAEIEADRLSVHLLANAGYDPRIAPAFWRGALGRKLDAGLFRSRIYASPDQRAAALEREITDYLAGGSPSWPGHLIAKR
jgi:hypothetical protein